MSDPKDEPTGEGADAAKTSDTAQAGDAVKAEDAAQTGDAAQTEDAGKADDGGKADDAAAGAEEKGASGGLQISIQRKGADAAAAKETVSETQDESAADTKADAEADASAAKQVAAAEGHGHGGDGHGHGHGIPEGEEPWWLDKPENVNKLLKVFFVVCVVFLSFDLLDLIGVLYHKHPHEGFFWEKVPGFMGIYGFLCSLGLVLLAKELRKIVLRPEDYYE